MKLSSYILVFMSLFVLCLTETSEIQNGTQVASNCGGNEKTLTFLDISKECIHRAKILYPSCIEEEVNCSKKEKSLAFLDAAMNMISEVKKQLPYLISTQGPEPELPIYVERPTDSHETSNYDERPMDCSDVLRSGKSESGIYIIWPRSRIFKSRFLAVYCDMDTDGGGWTVIQRRGNFSSPRDYFYKNWKSYKNGFGNLTEEFWIGNDNIHVISTQVFINKPYHIRFDLKDSLGREGYAEYSTFWIEDEAAKYTVHIDGYKGNVGDAMEYHNKMKFSTKDSDNDFEANGESCAMKFQGAWWYKNCLNTNLNGLYQPGVESAKGCSWKDRTSISYMGLSAIEIKLRF